MKKWERVRVGDVAVMKRGKYVTRKGTRLGNIPVILGGQEPAYYCDESNHEGPCVVISRSGASAGFVSYWDEPIFVTDGFLFEANERCDIRFLYYCLKSNQSLLGGMQNGSGIPHVQGAALKQFPISLPPLSEQRKIANELSTIDRKIALNRKRIATLEAMAKEIYDYWFVQFDFPDAHGRPYKSSGGAMVYNPDLKREIPKGWEVKALGELMNTNASSYSDMTLPSRIQYIDIAAVSNGAVSSKTEYDKDHAPGRARRIAKRGDTIWSSVRPNLKAYALILNPQKGDVFSTGFAVLSPVDVPYGFLYLTVTAEAYVSYLVSRAGNSAYPAVLPSAFGEYEIAVPPRDLLDRFACQTEGMFELRQNCFDEIQSLSSLRDFLLPLLMNGQVKVG